MAGERTPKLTIRCSWDINANVRGDQTQQVRFKLGGQWVTYQRGGGSAASGQFAVPAPGDDDPQNAGSLLGPNYVVAGVRNLVACLQATITARSLPYTLSAVRDAGGYATGVGSYGYTGQPLAEFDIVGTWALNNYDLDFQALTTHVPSGWEVVQNLTAIQFITAYIFPTDAVVYGTPTGHIKVVATGGTVGVYSYQWDDGATGAVRQNVLAGAYGCTITDQSGASTYVTTVVNSDPQLLVQVTTTDTSIRLTVTGGVGPYTTLWADGDTTAYRQNLAPGVYDCTITDQHGATVTVQVTLSVAQFYWSRNAITLPLDAGAAYRVDPTTKPNLSFLCEVWVELEYLSGTFVQVGPTLEQPADAQGRTTFEVSALLNPYLAYHVPAPGLFSCERADALFRRFYLRHAESYGSPPVAQPALTLEQGVVALGGLSFYEAQARTWFASYQPTVRPFLTWEPTTKAVLLDQPEYLYHQVLAGAPADFRLQVRALLSDHTEVRFERASATGVRPFEIYCLPVGYDALGLAVLTTADRRVTSWQVWVATPGGGTVLSETRTFTLHRRRYPHRRYLLFATSLGGMATYAVLGEAQRDAEVSGQELALSLPPDYDPALGDTQVLSRSQRPVLKLAAGKRSQAQLVASQDLLLSRRVLLLSAAGRWLPGYLKAKTVNLWDEGKLVQTQDLEFVLPAEQLYTPSLPATLLAGQAPIV